MADIFSPERRKMIMSNIKGKNTKPELLLRRGLHSLGLRFRLHDKSLPGTPDIVLKKFKTAIFVNGCFWHGHDTCKRGILLPKTRTDFWSNKIENNKARDKRNIEQLKTIGWNVIVVFECELKAKNLQNTLKSLQSTLMDVTI